MPDLGWEIWIFATLVATLAGVVKGVVGFAMPMIMISGLATFVAPDLALAMLILPTVATNLWQASRGGIEGARRALRTHWLYLSMVLLFIALSAQLVYVLPERGMFLLLGVPVTLFAVLQLMGWRLSFPPSARRRVEASIGAFAGFVGGISGVWGPPTVAYLTALGTEKREQVQVQGVVYGSGAVVLLISHLKSGVLTGSTALASAAMLLPALLGMAAGFRIHDRLDQERFRRVTLVVLVIAGLNLIRRGLLG